MVLLRALGALGAILAAAAVAILAGVDVGRVVDAIGYVEQPLVILTLLGVVGWQAATVRRANRIAGSTGWTPFTAIVVWIIPFVFLIWPYRVMVALWAAACRLNQADAATQRAGTRELRWWWAWTILRLLATRALMKPPRGWDEPYAAVLLVLALGMATAAACFVAARMVGRIAAGLMTPRSGDLRISPTPGAILWVALGIFTVAFAGAAHRGASAAVSQSNAGHSAGGPRGAAPKQVPSDTRAHDLLEQVKILIDRRQYEQAKPLLAELLRIAPNEPETHYWNGRASGTQMDAVTHYRRAIDLNPAYSAAYVRLGLSLVALGRSPEARSTLEGALELHPSDDSIRGGLALVLIAEADRRKSDHSSKRVEENRLAGRNIFSQPPGPDAEHDAAQTLCLEGLSAAQRAQTETAEVLYAIGRALVECKYDNTEAIPVLRRALERPFSLAATHRLLGQALVDSGRGRFGHPLVKDAAIVEEGLEHLRQAVVLNPNSDENWNALALSLRSLGRREEAERVRIEQHAQWDRRR